MGSDWSHDNPAGRLHALLLMLGSQPHSQPLAQAWKNVLGTADDSEFQLLLADVSKLVPSVQQAVTTAGSHGNAAQVERYRAAWSNPIFPQDRPFSDQVHIFRPPSEALDALASVAEYLHEVAPEGMPTSDSEHDELRAQVNDLIEDVKVSDDLPDDVRQLILERLDDVTDALDHFDIGGPGAVKHATEALAGAIDLAAPRAFWRSPAATKARAVVLALWMAFTAPGAVHEALPVWEDGISGLMSGPAQVRPGAEHDGARADSHSQKALPSPKSD